MIEIRHLSRIYGKKENAFQALKDINFAVESGTSLAIVGKSGSGKSTLMHIMSGLDRPSEGEVVIDGVELFRKNQKEMDKFRASEMSFIFQSFFIEANQTCYQNVMLPLEIARIPLLKRRKLVMDALEAVELTDKAQVLAANLSGGQKQRLAIARAIVNQPKILFADEPTGNLDSTTGRKIINLLFNLNKTLGCTLILVTHDADLAKRCKTRVSLKDGQVISITKSAKKKEKQRA
jgi:putative ABC transport system ATP-binding protein